MDCILHLFDLSEYIEGQVQKPDPENKNAHETWRRHDNIARFLISINIRDEEMPHIYESSPAADMWRNLSAVHEAMTWQATMDGLRALVRAKWVPRERSLPEHFNEMKRLNDKLLQLGLMGPFHRALYGNWH
ncbi:hypothetical protein AZE42_10568 [Rhizopogon vesiculosus]|uniref:Uncharacterized protein n=1 Tax=Rhizopogon vesiculosus TaxID=180088 RepID=A0A1J8QKV4_9AGAM|nr:hypothetical protein AZE42_10568 [Rhizopogon vesiculosus]